MRGNGMNHGFGGEKRHRGVGLGFPKKGRLPRVATTPALLIFFVFLAGAPAVTLGKTLKARAEITLISGRQKGPKKLPKQLAAWRKKLTKPPFSVFKSFSVLKKIAKTLTKQKSLSVVLAGPYVLHLKLIQGVKGSRRRIRYRFHLKLLSKKGRKSKLLHSGRMLLDKGGTFFIAGPRYKGGTLILGITLK